MISLTRNLRLLLGNYRLPVPLNQQAKKGVPVVAGITDLVPKRKLDYNFTMEGRKTMSGIHEILCGIS